MCWEKRAVIECLGTGTVIRIWGDSYHIIGVNLKIFTLSHMGFFV